MSRPRSKSLVVTFDDAFPLMLQDVQNGESIENVVAKWAKELRTNPPALTRRFFRARSRLATGDDILDHRRVIIEAQEHELLGLCKALAAANCPLRVGELIELVRECRQHAPFNEREWLRHFFTRYKAFIVIRSDKIVSSARSSIALADNVEGFISCYEELCNLHPVAEAGNMSLDEFVFAVRGSSTGACVVEWKRRRAKMTEAPRCGRMGSLLLVTSATGSIVAKFFCLAPVAGGYVIAPEPERLHRGECPFTFYCESGSGLFSTKQFRLVTKMLVELKSNGLDSLGAGLDRHLRMDNVGMHLDYKALKTLVDGHIFPSLLMTNATAFLAVEDDVIFAVLRNIFNSETARLLYDCGTRERQLAIMWSAVRTAEGLAFRKSVVQRAYANVGYSPWSPEVVRERTRRAVGAGLPRSSYESPRVVSAAESAATVINRRRRHTEEAARAVRRGRAHDEYLLSLGDLLKRGEEKRKRDDEKEARRSAKKAAAAKGDDGMECASGARLSNY